MRTCRIFTKLFLENLREQHCNWVWSTLKHPCTQCTWLKYCISCSLDFIDTLLFLPCLVFSYFRKVTLSFHYGAACPSFYILLLFLSCLLRFLLIAFGTMRLSPTRIPEFNFIASHSLCLGCKRPLAICGRVKYMIFWHPSCFLFQALYSF